MKRILTQQQLTQDAVSRRYTPGTVVRRLDGSDIQLTSWPWFEGQGSRTSARVMARIVPGDATTNVEVPYFSCVQRVRDGSLD